jgi:archaellum biogenesis ATPase FlaH
MHAERRRRREAYYLRPISASAAVYVSGDNDKAGAPYRDECGKLLNGKVRELRILTVPEGFKDWAEWDGDASSFKTLLDSAPAWPAPSAEGSEPGSPFEADGVVLTSLADIEPRACEWAWKDRIPLGSVTLVAGDPGLGKSTITMTLAADWSEGKVAGALLDIPTPVIIASAEDSAETTISPRLCAAGANNALIKLVTYQRDGISAGITLPDDLGILEDCLRQDGAKILIIDPLLAHMSSDVNSFRDQDVRRALAPLSRLAENLNIAVVTVMHLNKDESREILNRISSSMAFVAVARSVLLAGEDRDRDDSARLLFHIKCNVGRRAPPLRYSIHEHMLTDNGNPICTSKLTWEGEAPDATIGDMMAKREPASRSERAEARDWLRATLTDGPLPAKKVIALAKQDGIAEGTLRRAKCDLNIRSAKDQFAGEWSWSLPPEGDHPQGERASLISHSVDHLGDETMAKTKRINALTEDDQRWDVDHLRAEETIEDDQPCDTDYLHKGPCNSKRFGYKVHEDNQQAAPMGAIRLGDHVQFDMGLGVEVGIVKHETTWEQYPGQQCYVIGTRTVPLSKVKAIMPSEEQL